MVIFPNIAAMLLPSRLIPLAFSLLYAVLYFPFLRKDPRRGYFAHAINMLLLQACICSMTFVVFREHLSETTKLMVISGWAPLFIGTYLASDGFKRYLWFFLTFAPVGVTLALVLVLNVGWREISYFSNPAALLVIAIMMGLVDEKLRFRGFKARHLVIQQKLQLEVEIEHRKKAERSLELLAATDELTGLFNRRATIQILRKYVALSRRHQKDMTLFFIDMDNLKYINDVYGHQEGDTAIQAFSEVLLSTIRDSDHVSRGKAPSDTGDKYDVGRLGGDEFLIILFGCNKENSDVLIGRIAANLEKINASGKHLYKLDFSYGAIAYDPNAPRSPEEMIEDADKIMYEYKQNKKRRAMDKKHE